MVIQSHILTYCFGQVSHAVDVFDLCSDSQRITRSMDGHISINSELTLCEKREREGGRMRWASLQTVNYYSTIHISPKPCLANSAYIWMWMIYLHKILYFWITLCTAEWSASDKQFALFCFRGFWWNKISWILNDRRTIVWLNIKSCTIWETDHLYLLHKLYIWINVL